MEAGGGRQTIDFTGGHNHHHHNNTMVNDDGSDDMMMMCDDDRRNEVEQVTSSSIHRTFDQTTQMILSMEEDDGVIHRRASSVMSLHHPLPLSIQAPVATKQQPGIISSHNVVVNTSYYDSLPTFDKDSYDTVANTQPHFIITALNDENAQNGMITEKLPLGIEAYFNSLPLCTVVSSSSSPSSEFKISMISSEAELLEFEISLYKEGAESQVVHLTTQLKSKNAEQLFAKEIQCLVEALASSMTGLSFQQVVVLEEEDSLLIDVKNDEFDSLLLQNDDKMFLYPGSSQSGGQGEKDRLKMCVEVLTCGESIGTKKEAMRSIIMLLKQQQQYSSRNIDDLTSIYVEMCKMVSDRINNSIDDESEEVLRYAMIILLHLANMVPSSSSNALKSAMRSLQHEFRHTLDQKLASKLVQVL